MPLPSGQGTQEGQVCYLDMTSLLSAARPQHAELQEVHTPEEEVWGVRPWGLSMVLQAAGTRLPTQPRMLAVNCSSLGKKVGLGPPRIWH